MLEVSKEPSRVRDMFASIAGRYDLLNHLLSANLDRRWRRDAVRMLPSDNKAKVLDLCGGTGDVTLEIAGQDRAGWIACCDFARPMLTRARAKFERRGQATRCVTLEADAMALPFPDETFDAVTVAFGVRNLVDLDAGLREACRVVRPGGVLVVLEFSRPQGPMLSRLYRWYLHRVLPGIGDGVSGRSGPYGYLARTIGSFPDAATLAGAIRGAGFAGCEWVTRSGGIVAIHRAMKAG